MYPTPPSSQYSQCHRIILTVGFRSSSVIRQDFSELQIRGGYEDNSKIISLFINENLCCDPSLELSRQDSSNDGSQHRF